MTDANTHGKPHLDMITRQQEFMKGVKVAMGLIWQVIQEAETEGLHLDQREAEFDRARTRGETPDPIDVERVRTAQVAICLRMERLQTRIDAMNAEADIIIQTADEALFNDCVRQFNTQFGTTEGL